MQRRLEELDRMGGLDSLRMRRRQREVEATMQDDDDRLDLGENNIRQRDWEFLEALFDGAEGEGGTVDRRSILAGMLSGMSVRMLVEREERKRRERRSKLLAALKETSMVRERERDVLMENVSSFFVTSVVFSLLNL